MFAAHQVSGQALCSMAGEVEVYTLHKFIMLSSRAQLNPNPRFFMEPAETDCLQHFENRNNTAPCHASLSYSLSTVGSIQCPAGVRQKRLYKFQNSNCSI